jgi:Tol biopolymer transport system component
MCIARLVFLGIVISAACGDSGGLDVDDGDNNGLTYGDAPTPMPALEAIPYDALGSKGRLVFERIYETGITSGLQVIDVAARTSWGFSGEPYSAPAVSPDGQTIAFSTLSRTLSPPTYYDLYATDMHGGNLRRLSENEGQDAFPAWSPDGSEIYYRVAEGINTNVYRRPPQGSAALKQQVPVNLHCVDVRGPISVSSNRRLLFSAAACTNSTSPVKGHGIYVFNTSGNVVRVIGSNEFNFSLQYHVPAWSPDGSEIAFLEHDCDLAVGEMPVARVRLMNADGTGLRTIAQLPISGCVLQGSWAGYEYALAWSPDGQRIAFNNAVSAMLIHIHVVKRDGTGLTQVTTARATDRSLSWSQ